MVLFSLVSELGKLGLTECSQGVQNEKGWITADSLQGSKATAGRELRESSQRERPERRVGVLCAELRSSCGNRSFSGAFALLFWCKSEGNLICTKLLLLPRWYPKCVEKNPCWWEHGASCSGAMPCTISPAVPGWPAVPHTLLHLPALAGKRANKS